MVIRPEEALPHDNGKLALLGEGVDRCCVLLAIKID